MFDFTGLSLSAYLIIFATLAVGYVIFGIVGFGTALVVSPVLAFYVPVSKIVPLLALLDFCAAAVNVGRDGRKANWQELRRLLPLMVAGSLIGAAILLNTRPDVLLLGLGVFVVGYALYSLSGVRPQHQFSPAAALPFGAVGGVFSALFGSGGFVYIIYLTGRIADKTSIRLTQTTLIGFSTFTRVVLFALAGVYLDTSLLWLALLLAPGMLAGTAIGRRITLKMSREQFIRVINLVVLASGIMLLVRYFAAA
ncbi:sulfite exporter TauE/SafE family protein [Pseudomonas massiliensis]|uniref:sulfite exporter TauE/SafE family protein n=1 Tax=Pseudomonas massiliensis TaxID=522492 RepID=UPI00059045E9|nr:sulfite exporter TauE/SafE family protein [Pseudomonas massiliensis]